MHRELFLDQRARGREQKKMDRSSYRSDTDSKIERGGREEREEKSGEVE